MVNVMSRLLAQLHLKYLMAFSPQKCKEIKCLTNKKGKIYGQDIKLQFEEYINKSDTFLQSCPTIFVLNCLELLAKLIREVNGYLWRQASS